MTPLQFAVIGKPITHSLSPAIHQSFAAQFGINLEYHRLLGDEQHFAQQISNFFKRNGNGMNVTLPFKEHAFQLAQVSTERCQKARSANTLWKKHNQLHADNTDGIGLINDLKRHLVLDRLNVLILGAGGAARGIIYPLLEQGIKQLAVYNRSPERLKALASDFPDIDPLQRGDLRTAFDLVINATSSSTLQEAIPLPEVLWSAKPFCYDLSYQKEADTSFVSMAKSKDCQAIDGLGMLVEQAAEAFSIWHGVRPDTQPVLEMLRGNQVKIQ
ncbi:shikimate 5-dehydrogenase [Legionella quinlivanii]|uniref:Shikimate dehydrogenase (NADP(+)) n=1 Tax=Legionella quinlivanii TaxID=45073 RepID=A0A0W0Y5F5_9GAMM|nr:shikimate dehydrogenase [Legionella quinlivanii]KTD51822.1 shikimate 5-dehydrogenase [Legionella quinlivanii]MCW8452082.1 shikimate dehydrogenase [Legionella quinlivanii]SEF82065.1 shikimate dehydrogenase [Legionella quinlivanii DSM 21216]STY09717.1 shikimate 5-dehydrogenase [Legionella quinlivanii]